MTKELKGMIDDKLSDISNEVLIMGNHIVDYKRYVGMIYDMCEQVYKLGHKDGNMREVNND